MNKTYTLKKEEAKPQWLLANAKDQVLGRFASQVASILKGKHKPTFTPHMDSGDFVIVLNASKIRMTADKMNTKMYYNFTGYRGHLREMLAKDMLKDDPEEMIRLAVWGMLPKNTLGRRMLLKLHVYGGAEHPHIAQKPESIDITKV